MFFPDLLEQLVDIPPDSRLVTLCNILTWAVGFTFVIENGLVTLCNILTWAVGQYSSWQWVCCRRWLAQGWLPCWGQWEDCPPQHPVQQDQHSYCRHADHQVQRGLLKTRTTHINLFEISRYQQPSLGAVLYYQWGRGQGVHSFKNKVVELFQILPYFQVSQCSHTV